MTEIENLKDKVMSVEDAIDNNNQETTESPINDLTFYHSVLIDEVFTPLDHLVESDKLFASFKSVVQDFDFDLLVLSQLVDLPIKNSISTNLIEL